MPPKGKRYSQTDQEDILAQKIGEEFEKIRESLDSRDKELNESITQLSQLVANQASQIEHFERLEFLEQDKKRKNLIITGLEESDRVHVKTQVNELLSDLGVGFTTDNVDACGRLGQATDDNNKAGNGGRKRARPIKVRLANMGQKQTIYRNIAKLKGKDKWKNTHINDDLPQDESRRRRELRALAAVCRGKGSTARVYGSSIDVDGQRVQYQDTDKLPVGLRIEDMKIIEVADGTCFQSHHAYLSNMYPAPLKYDDGKVYPSAEVLFQTVKANLCGQPNFERKYQDYATRTWRRKKHGRLRSMLTHGMQKGKMS